MGGQDSLEKFQALDDQFVEHSHKFSEGARSNNFYKAKKALNDMITFHNEMVKIRDRHERLRDMDIVAAMDQRLSTTRSIFTSDRLNTFNLEHREIL